MATDKLTELLSRAPSWLRLYNRKYQLKTVMRMNDVLGEKGLTQKEVAERAGWSKGYVSRILSGRENITLRTLARFEDAVGADVLLVSAKAKATSIETRRATQTPAKAPSTKIEFSMDPGQLMRQFGFQVSHNPTVLAKSMLPHHE